MVECGDPKSPYPNKDPLATHKHTPWESSGVHLRNFSNTAEPKNLRITTQKGKEDSCILPASSHLTAHWHCSAPRGNSQLKRVLPGEEEWRERAAFRALQCTAQFPLQFQPSQRLTKQRCTKTARNKN